MATPQTTDNPQLYQGERLESIAGYPTLFKYLPSSSSSSSAHRHSTNNKPPPLIVFIPGAAHLARIAYGGHAGYDPQNFLAYWLNEAGYDVLAISYPLETTTNPGIVAPHYPDFRVPAWGEQAARTTRKVVDENENDGRRLSKEEEVILLAWSMGGKILKPFVKSARDCGLRVKLFVALAATPGGIMGLRAYPTRVQRTEAGYGMCVGYEASFLTQIHQQQDDQEEEEEENEKNVIIDDEVYLREYFGHTPVRLTSWGLTYPDDDDDDSSARHTTTTTNNNKNDIGHKSGFIADEWESLRDGGPTDEDIRGYPYIGSIRPTSPLDMRHTLCDSANWGMILTLKLTADVTQALGSFSSSSSSWIKGGSGSDYWQQLVDLIYSAPAQMTTETVSGTHYFFLGKRGARETSEAIVRLIEKMERIERQMAELLGKLKKVVALDNREDRR